MGEPNLNTQSEPPAGGGNTPTVPVPPGGVLPPRRKTLITVNAVLLAYSLLCLFPFVLVFGFGLDLGELSGRSAYCAMVFVAWVCELGLVFWNFVDLAMRPGPTPGGQRGWKLGCAWTIVSFWALFALSYAVVFLVSAGLD